MLLSIGMPTYNRGNLALEHVREILSIDSPDIQLVVSNNGSEHWKECYEEIKNIQDPRLVYSEFESNQGGVVNFSQVLKLSTGDFCMLLSDEDSIVAENLPIYLDIIRKPQLYRGDLLGTMWDTIGVIFGSTTTFQYPKATLLAGEPAIRGAYMIGNYMSGLCFNRKVFTNQMIDDSLEKYKDNIAKTYIHMLWTTALIVKYGCVICDVPIVRVGEQMGHASDVLRITTTVDGETFLFHKFSFATWEHRLAQMKGFCEQIKDLDITNDLRFLMFCMLCNKTLYLLRCAKSLYTENNIPWDKTVEELVKGMFAYLDETDIKIISRNRKAARQHIIEAASKITGVMISI